MALQCRTAWRQGATTAQPAPANSCLLRRAQQQRCSRRLARADGSGDDASSTAPSSRAAEQQVLTVQERRGPVQPLQLLPGETISYESSGTAAELALSLALAATLIYIPLTVASVGRRLWIKTTFTNKRVVVTNSSPLFSRTTQVPYSAVREVRTVPRALGAWGDMVIILKDGSRLELPGLEAFADIKRHIEACMTTG